MRSDALRNICTAPNRAMSEGVLQCGPTHTHTRMRRRGAAEDTGLWAAQYGIFRTYQAQRLGLYAQQALVHEVQPESKYRIPNSKHTNTQTNKQTNNTTQHNTTQHNTTRRCAKVNGAGPALCATKEAAAALMSCRGALCCCCLLEPCCSTLYWAATRWPMLRCCSSSKPTCHGPTAVHVRVCRIALVVHVHVRGKAAASTVASRARTPLWKGPSEGGRQRDAVAYTSNCSLRERAMTKPCDARVNAGTPRIISATIQLQTEYTLSAVYLPPCSSLYPLA